MKKYVNYGASVRAAQFLVLAAKARALMKGRYHVTYEDIRALYIPVLRHRVLLNFHAESDRLKQDDILKKSTGVEGRSEGLRIHRRDAEDAESHMESITDQIIGAAIEVHRHTGPGLLESAYEECLCYELSQRSLLFQRQVPLPVIYKGVRLDCGFKMDLLVEEEVVLELKTVESLLPVHSAQLLTYLKLSGKHVGSDELQRSCIAQRFEAFGP